MALSQLALHRLFHLFRSCISWLIFSWNSSATGTSPIWRIGSAPFGGFDSVIYVTIAAVIFFFHRIQRLYRRMEADHHHLAETSHEILALNREMEALVMERTMSEMALGMAHGIRNPAARHRRLQPPAAEKDRRSGPQPGLGQRHCRGGQAHRAHGGALRDPGPDARPRFSPRRT